jgi:hypothetical protein
VPLEPPLTQTDARSISTISADTNERARTFSSAEIRRPVEDALMLSCGEGGSVEIRPVGSI